MKHLKLILILSFVLVILIGIKVYLNYKENTTYPLVLQFDDIYPNTESLISNKKVSFALEDRYNNSCENPLFFCDNDDIWLGIRKSAFVFVRHKVNEIVLNGQSIPCQVVYSFSYGEDKSLESVNVKLDPSYKEEVMESIIGYFGEKRVEVNSSVNNSYIWFFPNYYVYLEIEDYSYSDSSIYLKVSTYRSNTKEYLAKLVLYGGCSSYDFKDSEAQNQTSSRTYKYGDSDVYQGSSQQAADLAAIDAYFGF